MYGFAHRLTSGLTVPIDAFYLNGWKVVFTCILLFPGLGNLSAVVLRYRLKVPHTGEFAKKQLTYICESSRGGRVFLLNPR